MNIFLLTKMNALLEAEILFTENEEEELLHLTRTESRQLHIFNPSVIMRTSF